MTWSTRNVRPGPEKPALRGSPYSISLATTVFFIVGAGFSAAVGYLGMNLAVRANLRVAAAAESTGREPAMTIGLRTGAMVGMAAYGAVGSALNTGGGVAEDRAIGWLRQLRVTPMRPHQVVVGRALTASVTVLPAITAVLAAGDEQAGAAVDRMRVGQIVRGLLDEEAVRGRLELRVDRAPVQRRVHERAQGRGQEGLRAVDVAGERQRRARVGLRLEQPAAPVVHQRAQA